MVYHVDTSVIILMIGNKFIVFQLMYLSVALAQRFSTWGRHTPRGMPEVFQGLRRPGIGVY